MPENDDKLTLTLDTLRTDVERNPLADSQTVRRRGDQRTRRQAVGGAVAVVALVAGIAGVLGGTGGLDRADAPPATSGPTTSTSVDQPLALAADPWLTDPIKVGVYTMQRRPDSTEALGQKQLECLPLAQDLGATETQGQYFYSNFEGAFKENVLRFDDARAATVGLARMSGAFAACDKGDPNEVRVDDRAEENVAGVAQADVAVHASRLTTPVQAGEYFYYELGLVQRQNVVVVLEWTSNGNPLGDGSQAWVWTAERLQAAVDAAVD